jgi:hypothetical protein
MRFLTEDFVEFIECCVAREVRFLIVGGYALAAHGYPRATKDPDVGGLPVGFISAEDLIRNKRAEGRPQDLVDAAILEEYTN